MKNGKTEDVSFAVYPKMLERKWGLHSYCSPIIAAAKCAGASWAVNSIVDK